MMMMTAVQAGQGRGNSGQAQGIPAEHMCRCCLEGDQGIQDQVQEGHQPGMV